MVHATSVTSDLLTTLMLMDELTVCWTPNLPSEAERGMCNPLIQPMVSARLSNRCVGQSGGPDCRSAERITANVQVKF